MRWGGEQRRNGLRKHTVCSKNSWKIGQRDRIVVIFMYFIDAESCMVNCDDSWMDCKKNAGWKLVVE